MSKVYDHLNEKSVEFMMQQKLFFVASAPLSADGQVNLSPKGYDSLVVRGPNQVAWIDLGGSGIETLSHTRENGRMTLMFCAFEGPAMILRLYGKAQVTCFDQPKFTEMLGWFPDQTRARNIFVMQIERVSESCGWGVPFMDFQQQRDQLNRYVNRPDRSSEQWADRYRKNNAKSIDGLPGITAKDSNA